MRGAHRALYFIMDQYFSAVQQAAERSNAFNAEQAQLNRNWQAMMSNSAHQREVADLKAAGLNPVLSANSGASAPSGAQASANDTSGAIAGLLGQVINAQSAQAIAAANNSAAQLLEEMREKHDTMIHEKFPNNAWSLGASVFDALFNPNNSARQTVFGALRGLLPGTLFGKSSFQGSSAKSNGRSGKF